jgi:RNA polymerase sigma factor (sigma-70 family)
MESARQPESHSELNELQPQLMRFAQALGLSSHDAQDAVQDAILAIQRTLEKSDGIENLKAYAYRVVRHNVYGRFRQRNRRKEVEFMDHHLEAEESTAPDKFDDPIVNAAFAKAYAGLTEAERALIRMRYVQNRTLAEIGAVLGCTGQNAWKSIKRIIEVKLRSALKQAIEESDPDFAREIFPR